MTNYLGMAQKVIRSLIDSNGVAQENLAFNATDLAQAFADAEQNFAGQCAPSNVDVVVALSGRRL